MLDAETVFSRLMDVFHDLATVPIRSPGNKGVWEFSHHNCKVVVNTSLQYGVVSISIYVPERVTVHRETVKEIEGNFTYYEDEYFWNEPTLEQMMKLRLIL